MGNEEGAGKVRKREGKGGALLLFFLSFCLGVARAEAEPAAEPAVLLLTDALREALSKSPELAKLRLETEEAGLGEPFLLANTDPQFQADYLWTDDRAPRAVPAFQGERSRTTKADVGVVQNWLTGTQAGLFWRNERLENPAPVRPLDPSVDSRLILEVRQPLLRYFWGRPDRARRGQARAGVRAARERGRYLEDLAAAEAARAYLEVYVARENARIAAETLAASRRLASTYAEKRRYGLVEESDLAQAQVSVQIRETELALARSGAEKARNALLSLLQRHRAEGPAEDFEVAFPEELPPFASSLEEALRTGMEKRGDVQAAKAGLEAAEWGLRIAVLDGLPDLAVSGSYGVAGLDRTHSDAWSDLGGFDHPVKSAGLSLTVPFGRKREKLDRRAGAIRLESRRQEHRRVVQAALREIRDAWENRRLAQTRLDDNRRLVELQEKKMAAEEANFRRGRSSTDLLVRFQQDLQQAQSQFVRARADEALARLELGRAAGVLLDTLNGGAR